MARRPYVTAEMARWQRVTARHDWPLVCPYAVAPVQWASRLAHCRDRRSYHAIGEACDWPWPEVRERVRSALDDWEEARAIGLRARAAGIPWRLPTPTPQIMVDEEMA